MTTRSTVVRLPRVAALSGSDCRLLVDSVVDYAIFMLSPEGLIATWNAGAERIKGFTAEEIVGQPIATFYTPEDKAAGRPALALSTALRDGRFQDEGWRVRKDGTRFWADVVLTALRDEGGTLRGYAKITRDLTERRAAEEQLRRSEQRFHQVVDAVTDYAIFMLDAEGRVATWNSGARQTKGYEASEIIGRHFSAFYTPEDRAAGKPEKILETVRRVGRVEDETWRVRKDGTLFWADVVMTALRNEHGELVGYAKVTRDLTDRRAAEEELRRSEERFRLLVEGVSDYAIYMLDPEGRVSTWNRGAERMKGYAASEILGKSFELFFPEEDVRAGKPVAELETARSVGHFEDTGWRVRKDGVRFWANVVVTALYDASGTFVGFSKVTRDLTERREAELTERRLIEAQAARNAAEAVAKRAEEANRIKDEFLATVSHELRTPLNAIVGWAAMLRQQQLDPAVARAVEIIDRNAKAQVKIIEDILDVSRIVTGKLRIEPRACDAVAIAREAIEVVRPAATAKRISISLETSGDVILLIGDPERLQQVVWNLLSNAVKFTDEGGRVAISVHQHAGNVELTVADSGRGIEPEFVPFVFERFKQADSSTTRRFGGLGLGLALVRHIVELHGGSVAAESAGVGAGSTFRISLPVRGAPAEPVRSAVVASPPTAASALHDANTPSLDGVRVLVIDDEPDARELLSMLLTAAGAEIQTAGSTRDAIEAVRSFRPHVVVSDIGMPDEDGYSLARRLRALPPEHGGSVPSVALTAYTRSEDRTKALAAGFTTHIGKPVDPESLIAAVANLAVLGRR